MIARLSVVALITIMATAQYAFGCEAASIELKKVAPDFEVDITHKHKPIKNVGVKIFRYGGPEEPLLTEPTDRNGEAHIKGLAKGQYFVKASYLGSEIGNEWIEVIDTRADQPKIVKRFDFTWADDSYETNRVAGKLSGLAPGRTGRPLDDITHPVTVIYPGVSMTLTSAFSDERYDVVSDSSGEFIFGPVEPGTYVLTIVGGSKSVYGTAAETRLVLDVSPTLKRDYLSLKLQLTGCNSLEFALDNQN